MPEFRNEYILDCVREVMGKILKIRKELRINFYSYLPKLVI